MELKLIVLAGAKQGTEIPLKKDKFIIGRAKECSLSVPVAKPSVAVIVQLSAAMMRGWVRDLGSRNGTHVNEQKIEQEVSLKAGDELRVGPLKFRVAAMKASIPAPPPPPGPVKVQDLSRGKQPPVKDVAEVAERTIAKASDDSSEDDISRWLLGVKDASADAAKETLTIRLEETKTLSRKSAEDGAPEEVSETEETMPVDEAAVAAPEATEKSSWNWLSRGKGTPPKKKPGKLPPRPSDGPSKSSGEAAADVLREMTRRR